MKYLLVSCAFLIAACGSENVKPLPQGPVVIKDSNIIKKEQANPYIQTDISPMDMLYYPLDYSVKKMNNPTLAEPLARVIYSRPHRGGRKLFGTIVKWGQPWRLGANEATEIEFFQPVTILKNQLGKGKYIMYAVPYEDHWIIVFNKNLYSWGLKFNEGEDVLRVEVPAITKAQNVEDFTMSFTKTAEAVDLVMAWESMEVRLPIQF